MQGPEIAEVRDAITQAFSSAEFDMFLDEAFNFTREDVIAEGPFRVVVNNVVKKAVREGWDAALIAEVAKVRPLKPDVQAVYKKYAMRLIDKSLREEREEAQLAEKREELHGELAAMLYGIEAIPETPSGSTADAVMARVQAYREIKRQIERARDDGDDNDSARDADTETGDHSPVSAIVASFHQAWKWVFD